MESKNNWWQSIVRFVAWMGSFALAILDVLKLRDAVTSFLAWNQIRIEESIEEIDLQTTQRAFTSDAVVQWSTLLFGIMAVALVIWIEYYFRKGAAIGKLFQRIGLVIGVEVGILLLAVLVQMIFS